MKRLLPLACLLAAISATRAETKLSADAQAKLEANGLVVVDQPLRQGFSAYLGSEHPVFITSDSLLMAYHRIFEEMVAEMEAQDLAAHLALWPAVWRGLPAAPATGAEPELLEGHRRARLLAATAYRLLLGRESAGMDEEEKREVNAEVRRVEEANGFIPPAWIRRLPAAGGSVLPVNYASFRQDGSCEGQVVLERFSRLRKWLQEMQVDLSEDSTPAMAGFLAKALAAANPTAAFPEEPWALAERETGLLERLARDAPPLENAAKFRGWQDSLRAAHQENTQGRLGGAILPGGSRITRKLLERNSVAAASSTPLAVASSLGNSFASTLLDPTSREAVTCGDFSPPKDYNYSTGVGHYLDALRALNAPLDERVPTDLKSTAWQRKQLNTTLASWAEYRSALLPASREDFGVFGMMLIEPGFVEPIPDFFQALGVSAQMLAAEWAEHHNANASAARFALQLEVYAASLRQLADPALDPATRSASEFACVAGKLPGQIAKVVASDGGTFRWDFKQPSDYAAAADAVTTAARNFWDGSKPEVVAKVHEIAATRDEVGPRLARLATLCFRLQAMAEKQLSRRAWNDVERDLLVGYGSALGWLMFYEASSYEAPRDDAARIARYATLTNPSNGETRILHAATAAPRLFYIRYPNPAGESVLCQGAVYAYRDLERDRTPSRAEWQAEAKASAWPEWMKPVVGSYTPPAEK